MINNYLIFLHQMIKLFYIIYFFIKYCIFNYKIIYNNSFITTFKKSRTNQIIQFIFNKYGKSDDYDEIISYSQQEV